MIHFLATVVIRECLAKSTARHADTKKLTCVAVLDPSQRNLSFVQDYLAEHNLTAFELLSRSVSSYIGDQEDAQSTTDGESGTDDGESSDDSWKRTIHVKLDLLAKHVASEPTRDMEIEQYRCLTISPDDVLAWCYSQQETYLRLSKLASAVLSIPGTSAP